MQQLLRLLSEKNVTLEVNEHGQLVVNAPAGAVTPELGAMIRQHKAELLELLRKSASGRADRSLPRIVPDPAARHEPFPLNAVQHAYWIGRNAQMELGGVSTHLYFEADAHALDLERFEAALDKVIRSHDMLRATISNEGLQRVQPQTPPYRIRVLDLRGRSAVAVEDALADVRAEMSQQVFDCTRWPLFEVRAARLDHERTCLFFSWDFLVVDAWSILMIFSQWRAFYDDPALPPLTTALSFRDYILAERELTATPLYADAKRYWWDRIDSLPAAPVLPVRGRIEAGRKHEFVRRRMRLQADAWARLSATAQQHAITPSNLMLAAFAEVLDRWSKSRHYALNLTLFNRLPMHEDVAALVGDFTTLTITEIGRTRAPAFLDRAKAIQNSFLQDFEHRHFSGVEVLREMAKRRQLAGRVLMPVVFTSTMMLARKDGGAAAAGGGLEAFGRMRYGISQTPQVLLDCQIFEIDGELIVNWDAVDELFLPGVLDAMFGSLQRLIATLAEDPAAWRRDDLVPLPPVQQNVRDADHLTLRDSRLRDEHLLLHDGFVRQALADPDAIAIDGDATIRYGELLAIACDLADRLVAGGVRPNQLVGVVMEKGWQQIAAVLGILIAGGAYLPIDQGLPAKRQNHLLRHGEAAWVLSTGPVPEDVLEGTAARVIEVVRDAGARMPERPPAARQGQSDIAYVIFTSGSSGTPKGVVIDHRGALTTILAMNELYGVGPSDRVLAVSSLSFDLSVYDIFGLLAAGGTVVVPPKTATKDPAHWSKMIERHGVTLWNSAPQLMSMLVDYNDFQRLHALDSIRSVWLSGDWIPTKLPARIRTLIGPCEIISLGGATEGSIWSIHHRIEGDTDDFDSIPYGKALPGQSMHVFDSDLRPCPDHVIGHIYIGGPGVALGYWKDPERTAQRFFAHPKTGERLYWTGDLGRYASDGTIEFLGREDEQVKLHGHRVELGEIAAQLKAHPHVADAAVYIADTDDAPALIACVVPKEAEDSPLIAIAEVDESAHAARVARLAALPDLSTEGAAGADLARFGAFWRDLSALSLQVMAGTLRTLGISGSTDLDATLAAAGVLERFRFLVEEWIASLEDAGALERDAQGRLRLAAGEAPDAAIAAFEAEYGEDPRTSHFCRYIVACMRRQSELLGGQVTPLELLYPEGDFSIARQIYGGNPVSAHHNRQLAALFSGIVSDRPSGERLRILEVGAGTGTAAALLLPLLSGPEVEYWFTDVSLLFLERARQEFAHYPFVQYDLYNIDLDPQAQGFPLHDFDVIIASNTLHDAKHIPEAAERLRRLLKPGGHMLLIEGTGNSPWQWVTVGYLEGVDEYTDDRAGTRLPVLDTGRWRRALEKAGFDGVQVYPRAPGDDEPGQALRDAMPQHVIVARAPRRVGRFDSAPLREYMESILPAYMVPQRFVPMDKLPLTANGKIDRAALPRFQRSTQARARTHAPARPGTEQTLHAIWKEVLGLPSIGANDNFFDLGGDSLLLTQTLGKINRTLALDLAMADLFSYPTIRSLSEHIDRAGRGETGAAATAVLVAAPAARTSNDIAIIGMSGRFPDAPDIEAYWRNLWDGHCSVRDWSDEILREAGIPDVLLANPDYVKTGVPIADLDRFDATYFGFTPREALMMDPQLRFLLEEAVSAMEHAGYPHQKYGGEVGVYVGKDVSQYLHAHLIGQPEMLRSMGTLAIANLNEKDYAATQISYNLGFTGPSLNINTACSTSLVAVHQACRSLLDGECAIALAGAAGIETVQPTGYLHQQGSIVSADGRCRAFSDDSDGCMRGSGLGLVVLKPLERALADRDTVHAVIKGTAINNDGALKVGFTAPSMQGQSRVIAAALERAGLLPSQVQYVEAHGTGTALGDAVEVKGLNQVYNRAAGAQCLIGSVKTNFGHLDTAAGIAGLIKVVLALSHGKIPASLHFRAPNPRIDFGDGALRVNDRSIDWPATDGPRRAGVSSFGVGGTNAHVVLEQAPVRARAALFADAPRVFLISANNPRSLKTMVERLADWVDVNPGADADDVAYTLQVGRNAHAHRIAVVADSLVALRDTLRQGPEIRVCDVELTPTAVFVFSADAAVRPQSLAVLHRTQPAFREHFDQCAELVRAYLDADLGACLTARGAEDPGDPALAAALRFSGQYALARLWLSFGLRPEAMIGQDIGEYVAACVSGVFSLEEALSLVVVRAQLIESTDPAATRVERIASILDTFADCLRETRRGPIGLPLVSGVDGAWVDDAGIDDPDYWLRHLRDPDRFANGLSMLAQSRQRCFLAIGAATTPAAFSMAGEIGTERIVAMADADDGYRGLCAAMAGLWSNGVEFDWRATRSGRAPGRIPLPTYVFERESYWISPVGGDRAFVPVGDSGHLPATQRTQQADAVSHARVEEGRRRFPRPDIKTPFAEPADEVQRGLAEVWSNFLSLERVGVDDNFFELGGDSLLGVQVNERMKSELGIDLQIDKLFLLGTVRNIANYQAIVSGAKSVEDLSDEEVDGIMRAYENA